MIELSKWASFKHQLFLLLFFFDLFINLIIFIKKINSFGENFWFCRLFADWFQALELNLLIHFGYNIQGG